MKPPGLFHATAKPRPASSGRVVGRDVVAPMAVALLHAQRVERVVAGEAQAELLAGRR